MPLDPEVEARVAGIAATVVAGGEPQALTLDSTAIDEAPVAIYSVDLHGRVRSWNQACERLFGWTAAEAVGEPVPFIEGDNVESSIDGLAQLVQGASVPPVAFSPTRKDGTRIHVMTSASLLRDADGAPSAILAFAVDVTDQHRTQEAVEASEYRWRRLLENISDTVTVLDREARVRDTTGATDDVMSFTLDGWSGRDGYAKVGPDRYEDARRRYHEIVGEPGTERRDVHRLRRSDGQVRMIEYSAVNLLDDPDVEGVIVTTRDVTAIKLAEELLADEARVLELIARDAELDETLPEVVRMVEAHTGGHGALFLLDTDARPRRLRLGAAGRLAPRVVDHLARTALTPDGGPVARAVLARDDVRVPDTASLEPSADDTALMGDHSLRAVWAAPVVEPRGDAVLGAIAVYHTQPHVASEHEEEVVRVATNLAAIAIERNQAQADLYHQARHHSLTGLPNRRSLGEELQRTLDRAEAEGSRVAVMFVDLDRFKVVNDSLGHAAGDELLQRFGARLRNIVRPGDYVSHFGADEFVVVLPGVSSVDDVRFVANRLDLALTEPFDIEGGEIFLSTSIGVAVSEPGESPELVLQHADSAMFRAKEKGRDRLEVFDEDLRSRATEQLRVDRDLRLAIERSELVLHYQPKIDLRTGTAVGAEALLRWNHPERGMVHPAEFVPIAEDTGLIVRIGRWVLEEAVLQARAWSDRIGIADFHVAVNLSPRQIVSPDLVATVARVLVRYDWPPHQLALELTERVLVDDAESTLDVLQQLKGLGVKLAIDDFGTGFSSLSYLHRFPVDEVKLDRSFVTPLLETGEGSPVATAVVHMARALGLVTCAEGVEEPRQLAGLRALGCEQAQGFLFARPARSEDLERTLQVPTAW